MITTINEFRTQFLNEASKAKDFDPKDLKRVEDILSKSDKAAKKKTGNFTAVKNDRAEIKKEEETKAKNMAKAITNYDKAMRRGNAAKELDKPNIAKIFFDRAKELK